MAVNPQSIQRPDAAVIFAEVDKIQLQYDQEFARSYQQINRARAKTFFDAGFEQGIRATLAALQNSSS